ncbi:hypothetical protein SISNIDRAFT_2045 [Sistotremastrum niveocremeum HHB9708]|uniref:CBM21 domain-containing protein n=1 Tax=Sistotremastrum niveocremeum HHB9708 TaxID=1314777 RepID=A0A165ADC8_9AGAM|nr:hypothetical protein SISNIDRAFT_2045 [Sistotremastrum niveocremeum HHB9708]
MARVATLRIDTSTPPLLRKKSGELVKPSLKHIQASLPSPTSAATAESLQTPHTPSKAVHFDAQLEHVKLFLAEQKPLAVSRDGSPVMTETSDGESAGEYFGFRSSQEEEQLTSRLAATIDNLPPDLEILLLSSDVILEELKLSPSPPLMLQGSIRVRNLAFAKWVAVRFTLDDWQTTSEVAARYLQPVEGTSFDRFVFTIKLSDHLKRLATKTLLLCIRYTVLGKELWDNNRGQNYRMIFSFREPPSEVVTVKPEEAKVKAWLAAPAPAIVSLKSDPALSSRYDFAASFKDVPSWNRTSSVPFPSSSPPKSKPPTLHRRANSASLPLTTSLSEPVLSHSPTYAHDFEPWRMQKNFALRGSPREFEADDVDYDTPAIAEARRRPASNSVLGLGVSIHEEELPHRGKRRHHRSSYFDSWAANALSNVRLTPPGTPTTRTSPLPDDDDSATSSQDLSDESLSPYGLPEASVSAATITLSSLARSDSQSTHSSRLSWESLLHPAMLATPTISTSSTTTTTTSSPLASPPADYRELVNFPEHLGEPLCDDKKGETEEERQTRYSTFLHQYVVSLPCS